jgi:hypothetical protein
MIAVIGPKWLGGRGRDARINANDDPVRIGLETAFQQGMRIIPVLVSGAAMPKAAELPQSLQGSTPVKSTAGATFVSTSVGSSMASIRF